ncbi:MAG: PAS domain-containing protein [candidate division Zixibacteria bacterium]|nr:PAS domain-containing protein [candidate division Zixibacteria bacterium]
MSKEQTKTPETTAVEPRGVKRCAVCKIDLKGRFVLVNDEAERIIGLTKEELFGRFLSEFLLESDRQIIQQILRQRNHYDSFFETTHVTLIDTKQNPLVAKIFISLNYIAGNPANYQIIFSVDEEELASGRSLHTTIISRSLLHRLARITPSNQWAEVSKLIIEFGSIQTVLVYSLNAKHSLTPIAAVSVIGDSLDSCASRFPTGKLHTFAASSGTSYSCTNDEDVRLSIEREGAAPHEFVTVLKSADMESVLLRIVFEAGTESAEIIELVGLAQAVMRFVGAGGQSQIKTGSNQLAPSLLVITEKLVSDLGGHMEVHQQEGEGILVTYQLPAAADSK